MLKELKPHILAVISFSDLTEGHSGVIYKASNFYSIGQTATAWFFLDETGRLRHPRQCGVNTTDEIAKEKGWTKVKRASKCRFLYLLPNGKNTQKTVDQTV